MAAGTYRLSLEQGAGRQFTVTYSSGGAVVNITGWTIRMQIKQTKSNAAPAVVALSTPASGITIPVGTDGKFVVAVPAASTMLLTGLTYFYDILLTPPGGEPIRLLEGPIAVDPGVTT